MYKRNLKKGIAVLLAVFAHMLPMCAQGQRATSFGEVNTGKYSDNMTMTCKVMKGGKILLDCELAAFDAQGNLRGKAMSEPTDGGIIYLTVQGDTDKGKLHFQVADDNLQVLDVQETLDFQVNGRFGTYGKPYLFIAIVDLKGDVDGNGVVTIRDLAYLVDILRKYKEINAKADVDGNGKVELADVVALYRILLEQK